jgi:peptidoglycan/xylan/chitin deacetylase (PgdA/CDA1 family)
MIDDRDYVGYGGTPPDPKWPGGARIAVNINLNFEGGGERSVMDGDGVSEGALNDIGFPSLPGARSPMVESVFEYGSRVGGWRLLRLFRRFGVKVCLLAVAKAAERNPEITAPLSRMGTRSSATAIAGSITRRCRKRPSASMSGSA